MRFLFSRGHSLLVRARHIGGLKVSFASFKTAAQLPLAVVVAVGVAALLAFGIGQTLRPKIVITPPAQTAAAAIPVLHVAPFPSLPPNRLPNSQSSMTRSK